MGAKMIRDREERVEKEVEEEDEEEKKRRKKKGVDLSSNCVLV